jgi:thiol-disulfide isomerase/thioredoxin
MCSVKRRVLIALAWGTMILTGGERLGHGREIPKSYGQPEKPQIVMNIQNALASGDLGLAEALATQYRRLNGETPEALEAWSWVARGELAAGQIEQALKTSQQIVSSSRTALGTRAMDAEPHLPLALGAAYEVEAMALYAQQKRAEALTLLQKALKTWAGTSLVDRLQKNINQMTLEGRPMPVLKQPAFIGPKPRTIGTQNGKVLLLFFWAHWCADCKAQAPIIAKLAKELGPKGLVVIAPTQRYGYTADEDKASPAKETEFIGKVFERYYAMIPQVSVPLDASNFQRFGASTTPTLLLSDRQGIVRLYHPGAMEEAALRSMIEPLLAGHTEKAARQGAPIRSAR